MQFTPALNRPPRGPNVAPKAPGNAAIDKRWVLAEDNDNPMPIGQVNYDKYAHAVAMPGPVLSAKTGK